MAAIELKVPDIGDFNDVEIIELLVSAGDEVKAEQSLVTVESDKASMEIPSSASGRIVELKVAIGDKVKEGSVIAVLESQESKEATAPAGAPSGDARANGAAKGAPSESAPSKPAPSRSAPSDEPVARGVQDESGTASSRPAQPSGAERPESSTGASTTIEVPDIGDFESVEVIEVLVAVGDTIDVEQSLISVESDKASMEIPSSIAGVVKELRVKVGDKISKGSPVAVVASAGPRESTTPERNEPDAAPQSAGDARPDSDRTSADRANGGSEMSSEPTSGGGSGPRPNDAPQGAEPRQHPVPAELRDDVASGGKPHASPSVRKFARELGVDLGKVPGTGPKQRITHEDVQGWVKGVIARSSSATPATQPSGGDGAGLNLLPWPKVDFAKFGPIEPKPLARIKKISAANLHRNWVMIPHVTNHDEADITELEAFRIQLNKENEKAGLKLTMLAFLAKVCVNALKKFPELNSSLDGDTLVFKRYYHIGFAADTPNGLVVPVVREADRKGLFDIANETAELARKARDGKLSPSDMQGGTFSISSLGGIGGSGFTPIINAPEVAILGVSRSVMRPVWDGKQFVPRLMLPLSLSYDHRVIDGALAARFNAHLVQMLGDFRRVLL